MSGTGRLPTLKGDPGSKKPSLKFKPKAVSRRTKEEREASEPKLNLGNDAANKHDNKKKFGAGSKRANTGDNKQRRMAKYLNNTHVISSGPLAAGNFIGGDKGSERRGFIRMEGSGSTLVQKGLESIENDAGESDDDDGDNDVGDQKSKTRFNMGREYGSHTVVEEEKEEGNSGGDSDIEMDEDALQAKRIEQLFPVRPVRIRHEDIEQVKKEIQESTSVPTTRESTPAIAIKEDPDTTSLQQTLQQREAAIQLKLKDMHLENELHSIDAEEVAEELKLLTIDYQQILSKIKRLDNKPNRFMVFQLPTTLPLFEDLLLQKQEGSVEEKEKKNKKEKVEKDTHVPQEELTGRVGSVRVHKSGKLTMKIGNVVMDLGRGAETTFLQDVVSLNEATDEEGASAVELLGRIDGRVVVTPRFP
ncbi:DNA-directed RNA polymerase III subunit C53 NDAI_0A02030 [Naumovozyma dairenensis CBS 421]|uniref:DNA-directed RNA polymerase III subunit RPC4 n=1 Tax=Naumovozyma dairenensis (strain ATCC 10597 / BCRC 20456 / CBS 421 / NBRC 0211 / NRRL Y-12639) TaxID=1071378 RepID=G0W3H3_NAUDC|nr:hypothetical protein NDAI_0A02030 [Naumovozyma dairenensis CBS 421]CCD22361.1 hypothetical protein NDAI_0A02030 [Naumovozyma dairenensis CBS 421]